MSDLTAGVDFETYYRKNHYSVQKQGVRGYVEHPEFDAYLVSIYTSDGGEFVGHPSEFDFEEIKGYTWLSHNRGFDQAVYSQAMTNAKRPIVLPDKWHCTADMAGFCGLPRDLGSLLNHLYGLELDKGVRDRMSGVKWKSLSPDQREELIEYAMEDVRYLPKLWEDLKHQWPEHEREMSDMTVHMKHRGLPINAAKLDKSIKDLGKKMMEFEDAIPWWDRETAKNKTPLSPLELAKECKRVGIPAPTSRAKGNVEAIEWQEKYGKEHKFVSAMGNWNSANTLIQKLISLRERLIFPDPEDWAFQGSPPEWVDGDQAWMPFGMKYAGTHTRRDSGGDGWNVLNMNRAEVFGINIRNHIQAPKGFKFISADYSQIEPRVLAWLVDDEEFLDRVRAGEDPYVSFGTVTLGHSGPWTPEDRTIWKVMVLQLGYQSGWKKFQMIAETVYKLTLSNLEAKRLVTQYRSRNRKVVKFWSQMEKEVRTCLQSRGGTGTCEVQLPSGAIQYYRDLSGSTSLKATFAQEHGFKPGHIYGGLICLAGDTQVLTEHRGWIPLITVTSSDRVFDGINFVNHQGVAFRGIKLTNSFSGVRMTPDHQVLNSTGWKRADQTNYQDAKECCRIIGKDFWDSYSQPQDPGEQQGQQTSVGVSMLVRKCGESGGSRVNQRWEAEGSHGLFEEVSRLSQRYEDANTRTLSTSGLCGVVVDESPMREEDARGLQELRGSGHHSMPSMVGVLREFLGRYGTELRSWFGSRPREQRGRVLPRELPMGDQDGQRAESEECRLRGDSMGSNACKGSCGEGGDQLHHAPISHGSRGDGRTTFCEPVFDITSAGPLSRFVVRGDDGVPFIVHNCENIVQSAARDCMMDGYYRIEKAGIPIVLRIYDEFLALVREEEAEEKKELLEQIMNTPPEWAPDLPIAAEANIIDFYTK